MQHCVTGLDFLGCQLILLQVWQGNQVASVIVSQSEVVSVPNGTDENVNGLGYEEKSCDQRQWLQAGAARDPAGCRWAGGG
jgi:hypothetical protein